MVQMRTRKFAFEINWPLLHISKRGKGETKRWGFFQKKGQQIAGVKWCVEIDYSFRVQLSPPLFCINLPTISGQYFQTLQNVRDWNHRYVWFVATFQNCWFIFNILGTFDSFPGNWNCLGSNTIIWSLLTVPLVKKFKDVSQFLPNPCYRAIQVKKCLFSKGYIFDIFILVSYSIRLILLLNKCIQQYGNLISDSKLLRRSQIWSDFAYLGHR